MEVVIDQFDEVYHDPQQLGNDILGFLDVTETDADTAEGEYGAVPCSGCYPERSELPKNEMI